MSTPLASRPAAGAPWCALLGLLGAAIAGFLAFVHLGLLRGELLGGAACKAEGAFNCHAVTGGAWGTVLGMPLALWGLLGYLVVFALALYALAAPDAARQAMTLTVALATLFVVLDAMLLALMALVLHYYCLLCLATYAVNVALLLVAVWAAGGSWWGALGRAPAALGALAPSAAHPSAWLVWGMLAVSAAGVAGVHLATGFVSRGPFGAMRRQVEEFIAKQGRVSVDTGKDPRIGRADAPFQIVEFSDFLCPACQRASTLNPIILAGRGRDTSFVFKHYPLDTSCNGQISRNVHPSACRVAAAAECAHEQGKFWEFHDLVFAEGPKYDVNRVEQDAASLRLDTPRFQACLQSGQGLEAVKRDIADGVKAGVSSTPTYIVNGLPIAGGMTPAVYEQFVAALKERR